MELAHFIDQEMEAFIGYHRYCKEELEGRLEAPYSFSWLFKQVKPRVDDPHLPSSMPSGTMACWPVFLRESTSFFW